MPKPFNKLTAIAAPIMRANIDTDVIIRIERLVGNSVRGSLGKCPGSNEAEMFYLLVPDPTGTVNQNIRKKADVAMMPSTKLRHGRVSITARARGKPLRKTKAKIAVSASMTPEKTTRAAMRRPYPALASVTFAVTREASATPAGTSIFRLLQ